MNRRLVEIEVAEVVCCFAVDRLWREEKQWRVPCVADEPCQWGWEWAGWMLTEALGEPW